MATTFEVLFLGTAADIDPIEGDHISENAAALVGLTFGSTASPLAYTAQRTLSPVDYSDGDPTWYDSKNDLYNETFSIDGGAPQTYDALALYNVTLTYTDGTPDATITAVIFQDTDGNTYLAPELSANADYAAMVAAPIESLTIDSVADDTGINLIADRQFTDFVCFAAGTRIATDTGEVPVERLEVGDRVRLYDGGTAPIRWIGARMVLAEGKKAPVLIPAGALGTGLPRRDLRVSRQHRMLARSDIVRRMFGTDEVLLPAHRLVGLAGIALDPKPLPVTYIHIRLDRHEVVLAEGAPSESLLLGPQARETLATMELDTALALSPDPSDGRAQPVRPVPASGLQKRCIARHARNAQPLFTAAPGNAPLSAPVAPAASAAPS